MHTDESITAAEYAEEVARLAAKYKKYGFDEWSIRAIIEKPSTVDLNLKAKVTGVKLGLATVYQEAGGDLFTMDEVCNALGMTEAEALDGLRAVGNGPVTIISTILPL